MGKRRATREGTRIRSSVLAAVLACVAEAGLSRADIASATGWSELRVYRLFNGDTQFRVEDLAILSGVLRRPIGIFFRDALARERAHAS